MYNRYIPQADGTYRRNRIPDQQPMARWEQPAQCPPREKPPCSEPAHPVCAAKPQPKPQRPFCSHRNDTATMGVTQFLKQLLPKDFDTGDLLVVILLLLMSGDCQENQNWAMLTLALYLFL